MTEREQADWLARAIDDVVHGLPQPERPEGLDDADLDSLMRVAKTRLHAAREAATTGLQHEGVVWQKLLSRLEPAGEQDIAPSLEELTTHQPGEVGAAEDGLQEIIQLRRRIAVHAASVADLHREDVWQRVQSRLATRDSKRGFFSFLRRCPVPSGADDAVITLDDDLLEVARVRQALAGAIRDASEEPRERIWARVSSRIRSREPAHAAPSRGTTGMWPRLAATGAAVAIVIAALGPIPATGLAGHPAADFARFVGERVGITETASPPPAVNGGSRVEGVGMPAVEAARIMGLPISEPTHLPAGFEQTVSTYFPDAITAATGGVFTQIFASDTGAIAIYQEAGSGDGFAVPPGESHSVVIDAGVTGAYFEGHWLADGWTRTGTETLIFERDAVRTTIQYSGPPADPQGLIDIARGMSTAR